MSKVDPRYAKALIDLALEKDSLDQVRQDMSFLQMVCDQSRAFVNVLRSPIINADKKINIIDAVGRDGKVSELTLSFAHLLVKKGREGDLPDIISAFIDQYNQLKDIHTLKLTTAVPVSSGVEDALKDKLRTDLGIDKVIMETSVNADLIGGFTLEFDGKMVDVSIARDLRQLRQDFTQNIYVPKLFK
jgi:F-type H+-transporting ATPase subunit delta